MAISASTLTTIAVFLPLLGVGGLPGLLFEQLVVLIPITLLISLFTALLLTPMLCSKLLKPVREKKKTKGRIFQFSERLFVKTEDVYTAFLRWSLKHRKTVIGITVVLFGISLLAAKMAGVDYLPEFDMGDVNVVFELEQGTRTEETFRITQKIEKIIADEIDRTGRSQDLRSMFSLTGQTETGLMSLAGFDEGKNIGTVMTKVVTPDERDYSVKSLAMNIEKQVREIPEIIKFHVSHNSILAATLTGNKVPVEVHLSGNNLDALNQKAAEITNILVESPLLTGIESMVDPGKEEINVVIDRQKAGALGLRSGAIALAVRQALYGADAGSFKEDGDEYDITVRLGQAYRGQVGDLNNIRLTTGTGQQIPLQQVARLETQSGPMEIRRESQQRIVYVKVNLKPDVDLGTGVAEVQQLLADIEIPEGVTMELAGQMGDQNEDMGKMIWAFVIGLILVYMVMASLFENLKHPLIIMFAVPLAVIGVIWAFLLTGTTLSMVSAVGIIMLVGVVVNNGIVLVDYINLLRQRGQSIIEAAANAGHSRLRPVVMTAFTTIFAMVPMAVSNGAGAEMWKPIGITVIGGLLISTLITLILIPVLYVVFHLREVKQ
ncbi:efflux RND transporter permease subunit, partial [bacterium]|nr:efflux RND transporter permease subunit [bacterium]